MSDPMSTPSIPRLNREALAEAIHRATPGGGWFAAYDATDAALAYIAAHQEPRACATCGAKCDRCPDCAADVVYAAGQNDAADEWVEVDTWDDLPEGARARSEWVAGVYDRVRYFFHRDDLPDDLPDDPRALIARELGPAKADTFLGLLDEHGWTVTRKGER